MLFAPLKHGCNLDEKVNIHKVTISDKCQKVFFDVSAVSLNIGKRKQL